MTTFRAKLFHPKTYKLLKEESGFTSYDNALKWVLKNLDNTVIDASMVYNITEEK